jgi:hypothetical protein
MRTLSLEQMENVNGGQSAAEWGCNGAMGLVGAIWSTAAGMATVGVGFAVAIGWGVFQTWVCAQVGSGGARELV